MKKSQQQKSKAVSPAILDLDPDAWPKFEALIKSAAKIGHKPHPPKKAKRTSKK